MEEFGSPLKPSNIHKGGCIEQKNTLGKIQTIQTLAEKENVWHFGKKNVCPHVFLFIFSLCTSAHNWALSCQNIKTVSLRVFT